MSSYSSSPQLPPPGWYPDPTGQATHRWWSGTEWTNDVHTPAAAPTAPTGIQQPSWNGQASGPVGVPMTADGVPLASWLRRVGGYLIDVFIVGLVSILIFLPFSADLVDGMRRLYDDLWYAAQVGGTMPDPTAATYGINEGVQQLTLVELVVALIYSTGMQMWRSATVGMLALGMRVVPLDRGREHHGLPPREAIIRNIAYRALGYLSVVAILNALWPLFNQRRQGLHDLIARTQVVRIR